MANQGGKEKGGENRQFKLNNMEIFSNLIFFSHPNNPYMSYYILLYVEMKLGQANLMNQQLSDSEHGFETQLRHVASNLGRCLGYIKDVNR